MTLRAVSLDCDNTLYALNRSAGIQGMCNRMATELGETYGFWETNYQRVRHRVKETEWRHTRCFDIAYRLGSLFKELGIDPNRAGEFAETYHRAELEGSKFFPEAPDMIRELGERYDVGITTDSPLIVRGDMLYLERAGINAASLDFVIASNGCSKRTGIPFRRLVRKMSEYCIEPSEIVHVGDSEESDTAPARKVGINSVLFDPTKQSFRSLIRAIECL